MIFIAQEGCIEECPLNKITCESTSTFNWLQIIPKLHKIPKLKLKGMIFLP